LTLVYLDTSNLAWLEPGSGQDPGAASALIELFRERHLQLVITDAHLVERAQTGTWKHIKIRLDVLATFPEIVGYFGRQDQVFGVEFLHVVDNYVRAAERQGLISDDFIRDTLFRETVDMSALRKRIVKIRPRAKWDYEARRLMVPAVKEDRKSEFISDAERAIQIGRSKRTPEALAAFEQLDKYIRHPPPDIAPELQIPAEALADIDQRLPETFKARIAAGVPWVPTREEMEDMYRHISGLRPVPNALIEDEFVVHLVMGAGMRALAASPLGQAPRRVLEPAVNSFNPYHAPAAATVLAFERADRLKWRRPETGNALDVSHISFSPYVDIFFTDPRAKAALDAELAEPSRAEWNTRVSREKVRAAADLRDLVVQVEGLTTR
jgi:hypothetical protein